MRLNSINQLINQSINQSIIDTFFVLHCFFYEENNKHLCCNNWIQKEQLNELTEWKLDYVKINRMKTLSLSLFHEGLSGEEVSQRPDWWTVARLHPQSSGLTKDITLECPKIAWTVNSTRPHGHALITDRVVRAGSWGRELRWPPRALPYYEGLRLSTLTCSRGRLPVHQVQAVSWALNPDGQGPAFPLGHALITDRV